jgi:glycosyltransferase involved in cell wall biosynthesis
MNTPVLSVLMPNYNHEEYIGEALEATLIQAYRPTEIIIIDDASTDNSAVVISQFAKKESIMSFFNNNKNVAKIIKEINTL